MDNLKTNKSLGQHWLRDKQALRAVCDFGLVHEHDVVLEIGPGEGTLTEVLLNDFKAGQVIAIEKDEQLAAELEEKFNNPRLKVIAGDILKFDLTELPPNYKVVANIPYYLTSNLLRVLSESSNPPKIIALLVQKEVAERIAASPGDMSLLSVSVQMYYEPHLGEVISAKLFTPPPKVDSQIVQLLRRSQPLFGEKDSKHLFRMVKAGFSNRRKTLENSLSAGLQIPKEVIAKNLQLVEIDPSIRPQELTLQQWIKLAEILED